jgi:hypothetical protein
VSVPCGVSRVAVVTGNLNGHRVFDEEVSGLETTLLGAGPAQGRQAVLFAGEVMLQVFEMPGYDPAINGFGPAMFERGRLDHLGFTVSDVAALDESLDRLVSVDASSGVIRRVGPMLSLRSHDPLESEGEINCLDPTSKPSILRDQDDVVKPLLFARMASALTRRRHRNDRTSHDSYGPSTCMGRRPGHRSGPRRGGVQQCSGRHAVGNDRTGLGLGLGLGLEDDRPGRPAVLGGRDGTPADGAGLPGAAAHAPR